jgi:WD40 repeat protein
LKSNVTPDAKLMQKSEDPLNGSNSLLTSSLLVAYSPDGKTIAVSTGVVRLWDTQTGKFLRTVRWPQIVAGLLYDEHITSITFSPDNKTLIVGITSGYNKVRVFDVQTGKQLRVLPAAKYGYFIGGSPIPVVLSPDGKLIATGGTSVRLWDNS